MFDGHCQKVFRLHGSDHANLLSFLRDREYIDTVEDLVLLVRGGWVLPDFIPGVSQMALRRVQRVVEQMQAKLVDQAGSMATPKTSTPIKVKQEVLCLDLIEQIGQQATDTFQKQTYW